MLRKVLLGLAGLVVLLVAVVATVSVLAGRPVDAPYPAVVADTSPEGVARGAVIYGAMCGSCHQAGQERAVGGPMADVPPFLGTLVAANLTVDPVAGIGALTDAQRARAIRFGVGRDNRWLPMSFAMGDADLAAVLGYLRSGAPEFAADPTVQPRSELSVAGRVLLYVSGALAVPQRPADGIPVPPVGDALAYGRYLAHDVFDCGGCHSPGYDSGKATGPDAFTGGFEFADGVVSSNLTTIASGADAWTVEELGTALRDGVRTHGTRAALRYPMPKFRGLQDAEVAALYAYLASLTPRLPEGALAAAPLPAEPQSPAELYQAMGCATCHRPGAPFHANILAAKHRTDAELARWIRNPEQFKPGTQMPTFEELIDEANALALARWVRQAQPVQFAAR